MSLDAARTAFRQWLHMPDTGALVAVLGTIAANRLEGDPVWLLLVGPPGGGKSEIVNCISALPDCHPTATLTEAALLSGTSAKEKAATAKGGLLKTIGAQGIIVCKDFGSVLSMNGDTRMSALAALREVYDGSWTRHVGTDGGRTLHWEGRVGLVGGCTPSIDRHHAVMGAMGERFTLYRLPEINAHTQARSSLNHAGRERQMRAELAAAATNVVDNLTTPRDLNDAEIDHLVTLTAFVVRARSAVERDSYTREVELVSAAELPGRLINVLARLLQGLDAIGCDRNEALTIVTKAALDSIPALRLAALQTLYENDATMNTNEISEDVRHPASTTRRALEDLVAHYLIDRIRQPGNDEKGPNPAHLWKLRPDTRDTMNRIKQSVPEIDEHTPATSQSEVSTYPESTHSSSIANYEEKKSTYVDFGNVDNGHDPDAQDRELIAYLSSMEPEPE